MLLSTGVQLHRPTPFRPFAPEQFLFNLLFSQTFKRLLTCELSILMLLRTIIDGTPRRSSILESNSRAEMPQHRMYRRSNLTRVVVDNRCNFRSTTVPSFTHAATDDQGDRKGRRFERAAALQPSSNSPLNAPVAVSAAGKCKYVDADATKKLKTEYLGRVGFHEQDRMHDVKTDNLSLGFGCSSLFTVDGPPRKRHRMRIVPQTGDQYLDTTCMTGTFGVTPRKMTGVNQLDSSTEPSAAKSEPVQLIGLDYPKSSFAPGARDQRGMMHFSSVRNVDAVNVLNDASEVLEETRDAFSASDLEQLTYYPSKPSNYDPIYGYAPKPNKIENKHIHQQTSTASLLHRNVPARANTYLKNEIVISDLPSFRRNPKRRKLRRYRTSVHDNDDDKICKLENVTTTD